MTASIRGAVPVLVAHVALLLSALLSAPAHAQSVPFELAPADRPRVEVASHLGWEGVTRPRLDGQNDRYDTGVAAASVGVFWTPHLKTEVAVGRSGEGSIYQTDLVEMRGLFPVYRTFIHTFGSASVSPALTYQFLENQWVHPFVTGGVHVVRERHDAFSLDDRTSRREVTVAATPFVGAGMKFFVSERVFIRTDARASLTGDGARRASWTAGVGVDF